MSDSSRIVELYGWLPQQVFKRGQPPALSLYRYRTNAHRHLALGVNVVVGSQ